MLNFRPEEIEGQRVDGDYADVGALCDDWETMYEVVAELAKRPCVARPEVREERGMTVVMNPPCGKCLRCRAKALVEGKKDG